jgi:hypothetical protein
MRAAEDMESNDSSSVIVTSSALSSQGTYAGSKQSCQLQEVDEGGVKFLHLAWTRSFAFVQRCIPDVRSLGMPRHAFKEGLDRGIEIEIVARTGRC